MVALYGVIFIYYDHSAMNSYLKLPRNAAYEIRQLSPRIHTNNSILFNKTLYFTITNTRVQAERGIFFSIMQTGILSGK